MVQSVQETNWFFLFFRVGKVSATLPAEGNAPGDRK